MSTRDRPRKRAAPPPAGIDVRKGQAPAPLSRSEFGRRFQLRFADPAFADEAPAIARLEQIAWQAVREGRKAPVTRPAGAGFDNPGYEASVEWLQTRERLAAAGKAQSDPASPSRVLLVCGSSRNDGTCPGEMSKTWRLTQIAARVVRGMRCQVDVLDLSLVTSEFERTIHPCKGCVGTAMPLCHWPCSCYPNHALGQHADWMAEIYERWVSAHGVILLTPTYWYQSPSPLKLMIDRMVCADGGNPDVTSTNGKDPAKAKALEASGWDYPKHLAGRVFGLVVHGDVAGIESQRRNLADWLDWMGLISAPGPSALDRGIGWWQPYYDSHKTLDEDTAIQEEVRNVARAVVAAVGEMRAGRLTRPPLPPPPRIK